MKLDDQIGIPLEGKEGHRRIRNRYPHSHDGQYYSCPLTRLTRRSRALLTRPIGHITTVSTLSPEVVTAVAKLAPRIILYYTAFWAAVNEYLIGMGLHHAVSNAYHERFVAILEQALYLRGVQIGQLSQVAAHYP